MKPLIALSSRDTKINNTDAYYLQHSYMQAIETAGLLTEEEQRGARKTLTAAALTYVAATAVALAQVIRLLVLFGGRSRRRD